MNNMIKVGFVCFGEVNTPFERLQVKHDQALEVLAELESQVLDAGIVVDDIEYKTADTAIKKLSGFEMSSLIVCVAGWVPSHVVIRLTDVFRNVPIVLWGMCGWRENGRIVTTADQAGTTALRLTFEEMNYRFKYIYSIIDEPAPIEKIRTFVRAAHAVANLRTARIGTMGYRDMLLYGTQYDGNSLRSQIGVEVEPFEMLEMIQNIEKLEYSEIQSGIQYIKKRWTLVNECADSIIEPGVKYALAIGKKIKERKFEAITLIDVDGMKKLLGYPPAIVFMLLEHYYGVQTIPENDVMGSVTQLIMNYLTGQIAPYFEYYEFFKHSVLAGVPDFVPEPVTDGDIKVLPAAFGLLNTALLNISKVKTGKVTCTRLFYMKGKYYMHLYTGKAKAPPAWEEYGWERPAPQLPSLEIEPDSCTVEEFSQKVSSQHVIVSYGNHVEAVRDMCALLDIVVV
jgi:L-arabinose isomerase